MELFYCWPYEELKVTKLEEIPRAFRFQTPWYATDIVTSEVGEKIFQNLFVEGSLETESQDKLLDLYRQTLSSTIHEPYAYILPISPGLSNPPPLEIPLPPTQNFSSSQIFAKEFSLPNFTMPNGWTWDPDSALQISHVEGTAYYSPLSLFSVFRRFFYLQAAEMDSTKTLYRDLPLLCPDKVHLQNALAYVITQNLHVTQKCEEVLQYALIRADVNESALREFINAERGHDKIMLRALDAIPSEVLKPWSGETNPTTQLLMDVFEQIAKNNFLAFAFAICVFERPQLEDIHPITRLLQENDLGEAARRYEAHHKINEDGDHDHIGFEMIQRMPFLNREEAIQATHWAEALSTVMTSHSASLLAKIAEHA